MNEDNLTLLTEMPRDGGLFHPTGENVAAFTESRLAVVVSNVAAGWNPREDKIYMLANINTEAAVESFVYMYSWDEIKRGAGIDYKGRLMDAAKKCLQLLLITDTDMC